MTPHRPFPGALRAPRPAATLGALGLLALALGLGACAAPQQQLVGGPLPPGVRFEGKWDSNYGRMELEQAGTKVSGTFEHGDGQLEGEAQGDLLLFDWLQPGDLSAARLPVKGQGWLRLSQDGEAIEGRWGYEEAREGGGVWRATRAATP